MEMLPVLVMSVFAFSSSVRAINSEWLSTPGALAYCTGDDAVFTWTFNSSEDVSIMFFLDTTTRNTIVAYYYTDGTHVEHLGYTGKAIVRNHTQSTVSVVLRDVTRGDTGGYRIELAGPGLTDEAQLTVYTMGDIEPNIQLDNAIVEHNTTVNITDSSDVILSVVTRHVRPASITIATDTSGVLRSCNNSSSCDVALSPAVHSQKSENVLVDIRYNGACGSQHRSFQVVWPQNTESEEDADRKLGGSDSSSALWIVVGVLLLLVFLAGVGVLLAFLVVRRKPESAKSKSDHSFVEFGIGCYTRLGCSCCCEENGLSKNSEAVDMPGLDTEVEAVVPMLQESVEGAVKSEEILKGNDAQTSQSATANISMAAIEPAAVVDVVNNSDVWREPQLNIEEDPADVPGTVQAEPEPDPVRVAASADPSGLDDLIDGLSKLKLGDKQTTDREVA